MSWTARLHKTCQSVGSAVIGLWASSLFVGRMNGRVRVLLPVRSDGRDWHVFENEWDSVEEYKLSLMIVIGIAESINPPFLSFSAQGCGFGSS